MKDDLLSVEGFVYIGGRPEKDEVSRSTTSSHPGSADEPSARGRARDPAFIMYTSGTTGLPEGRGAHAPGRAMGSISMSVECGFRHEDMLLNNKPLFHIAQLQLQFLPFVQLGGTNVLTRGFDVEETLRVCEDERVTVLHGVPTQIVMLVDTDLSKLRPPLAALRLLRRPDHGRRRHHEVHVRCSRVLRQHLRIDRGAHGHVLRL